MTGIPPEGYPPQNPNQGQPSDPYGQGYPPQNSSQGYQPYVPGQYPPPPVSPQGKPQYGGSSSYGENKPAKLSLIFGVLSVTICGFFTGIPAIILGIIGRKKADELGGEGKTKANVGLGLGIFNLFATIIWVVLVVIGTVSFPGSETTTSNSSGSTVLQDDVELGQPTVDISESGLVTFESPLTNKTDSDTAFSVDVKCDGGGESKSTTVDTQVVAPEETIDVVAEIQFNPEGTFLSVFCNIEGLKFKD